MRLRSTMFALTLVPLLAGGCDLLKPKVSQSKLEAALEDWLKEHDMVAKDIHCPGDQPLESGHTFLLS